MSLMALNLMLLLVLYIFIIFISKFILARTSDWNNIKVKYVTFEGWNTSTANIQKYENLPEKCQNYIKFIETFINVPIKFVGVGPSRENLITRF